MFNFDENIFSHMPFVAHGAAPDFAPKAFCCLAINGKWKIHHYENGVWKRIDTGLSEDATECAPCAEYDPQTGKWKVSYIAGGFEGGREFYLYQIADLESPTPKQITMANVGFVFKNRVVYAQKTGAVFVSNDSETKAFRLMDAEYLYRVSYNPNNPSELLISGQTNAGELFSRIYNLSTRKLHSLMADGHPAYKAALFNGECYYAHREEAEGFEDRHIVKVKNFTTEELDSSLVVEIDI